MEDAMIRSRQTYSSFICVIAGLVLYLAITPAQAALIFTGQALDITFSEPGFADLSDTVIAGTGPELVADVTSTSEIEKFAMIDFESIDIGETSILFTLRGDGGDFGIFDSILYQDTGSRSGASYIVALAGAPITIDGVSIGETTNVVNLASSDVTLIDGQIHFDISNLAIGTVTGGPDLGTIRLDVTLIPVPAALPLMLSGLAGLYLITRRRKLPQE